MKVAAQHIAAEGAHLDKLFPWQQSLLDLLPHQIDREVYFISDLVGNSGKSALCWYGQACENFISLSWSTRLHHAIVKHFNLLDLSKTVNIFVNVPRSDNIAKSISLIEKIKDGDIEAYVGEQYQISNVKLVMFTNMSHKEI